MNCFDVAGLLRNQLFSSHFAEPLLLLSLATVLGAGFVQKTLAETKNSYLGRIRGHFCDFPGLKQTLSQK